MSVDQDYLLTLDVAPRLAETVIDFLLLQEFAHGFRSHTVYVHHHEHHRLSLAEQVTGKQKHLRFQLYLDAGGLPHFLGALKRELAGSKIGYTVVPVTEKGVL